MMIGITHSLLVLCMIVANSDDTKDPAKAIEGLWIPVTAELAGADFPAETLKTMKLYLVRGKYVAKVGDVSDEGTLKLDAAKKPATMDITGTDGPNKGKTFLAIYELKGDDLKICYDLSGKMRPTEFKTKKDSQLMLAIYKREKKAGGSTAPSAGNP
jgi:uncharacterized protein (TIGR03067 family)